MYVSTIRCFLAGCYCNGCNGGGSDENAKATRRRRSSAFGMSAKKRSGRRPSTSAKFVFSAGQSAIKGLLWRNHRALTPTCSSASQVKLIIIFQSSPDGISACIFVIDSHTPSILFVTMKVSLTAVLLLGGASAASGQQVSRMFLVVTITMTDPIRETRIFLACCLLGPCTIYF